MVFYRIFVWYGIYGFDVIYCLWCKVMHILFLAVKHYNANQGVTVAIHSQEFETKEKAEKAGRTFESKVTRVYETINWWVVEK